MAFAETTLSSACAQTDVSIVVASATSLAAGRLVLIDGELMQVAKDYVSGTTANVYRGLGGSAQVAHVASARVVHGLASDFSQPPPGAMVNFGLVRPRRVVSVSATGTLTLPSAGEDLIVVLNGTNAITLTIPVPTKEMDGTILIIVSQGAAAHVPTFTGGVGGAGSNYDAFTFNATGRLALMVVACDEVWCMVAAPGISGTVTNIIAGVA